MKGVLSIFLLSIVGILVLSFISKDFLEIGTDITNPLTGKYTCHYGRLHCSCWSENSGCELGCSGGLVKTLYNQTSCYTQENLILTGFSHN